MARYEVVVQAVCVLHIEAESEELAQEVAWDEARTSFQIVESQAKLLTNAEDIDRSRRHADLVLEDV